MEFKHYANKVNGHVTVSNKNPGPDWVEVDSPESGQVFDLGTMSWKHNPVTAHLEPAEFLNVNSIDYGQADRLMKAKTVEELRSLLLEILGL